MVGITTIVVIAVAVMMLKVLLRLPSAPPVVAAERLPSDFIWGVSSSGIQSEGGQLDSNIHRLNASKVGAAKDAQDPYGTSVDFRHRYREDVALAKAIGINTCRVGISWPRIEPRKGQFDPVELAYYDDLIRALKEAGIHPLITLNHFDYPGWVMDQGGWTNPETVNDFVSYSRRIAERYHADSHWWLTFNEAAFFMMIDIGNTSPGWSGARAIRRNLIQAHRLTYDTIHTIDRSAMVSSNIVWTGDTTFSRVLQKLTDWMFLDSVTDKMDYIGVDYYMSDITDAGKGNANWYPDPPGLYRALRQLSTRFATLPILIAEIGMATSDGRERADGVKREVALRDTVYWAQRAHADGIHLIGYMVWSLTDNFEWGSYSPRFGLYTVNVLKDPTLARIPTAAVPAYRTIINDNGVTADYRPALSLAVTKVNN